MGLETPVILFVNVGVMITLKPTRLESKLPIAKFKGIDGNKHKRWSVWLNLMQRKEHYHFQSGWCMADVSLSRKKDDELSPL